MIDIEISKKRLDEIDSECEIILVLEKNLDHKWVRDKSELKKLGFEGEDKQTALISSTNRIYVGVGEFDREGKCA